MCEVVIDKLVKHEGAISKIRDFLRRQNTFNRGTIIMGFCFTACIMANAKAIDILHSEIKELKKSKGE